ncbi:MAG: 2-oxo-4-hydroxy-4-carboxy-5-ureidoimidazoline decarboxylase [Chloroflexi bacterium]|nr:2-oxo-4-hydroxy-4-carboxy-5-ureidoimidazoline decarboxylase [Chloroflexota bacterium]
MSRPTLEQLNASGPTDFATALRSLFETAPPLLDALYAQRPFASYAALIDTAEGLAQSMSLQQQVEVLGAHPRIGAAPTTLSAASLREQGGASTVDTELAELNDQYERKFGFRFVVFVNRRPKTEIVSVLKERLQHSRDEELATGLRDMFRIARDRLATDA